MKIDFPMTKLRSAGSFVRFAVLMSLYSRENAVYFDQCLKSIYDQTLMATEVVLVIDGPIGNELMQIISQWSSLLKIKTVPLATNVGLGEALRIGLNHCTEELIVRMDTDDICLPERFDRQVKYMMENDSIAVYGGYIEEVDPVTLSFEGVRSVPNECHEVLSQAKFRCPMNHVTVIFRKSDVLAVGSYQDLPYMEDYSLWLRLLANGYKLVNSPEVFVRARTGEAMVKRRRGRVFIESERRLHHLKKKLNFAGRMQLTGIFLLRLSVRLLPPYILRRIYKALRLYDK